MAQARPTKLEPPFDIRRDHVLGNPEAALTLVEYGSYSSPACHAAHEVVADLRDRFGERMRYVYRHSPGDDVGRRAAELAEHASATTGEFWPVHDALMKQGPMFTADDFARIASDFGLPPLDGENAIVPARVQEDVGSAQRSGVIITPTFFINGRRYEGPWDENTLAEAMLGTLGHRLHAATLNFARWAPAAGLLLLLMSVLAVVLGNSPLGPAFESLWQAPFGFQLFSRTFILPLLDWVNHGMLSIFFLVVGLEIKREFTVGHLLRARGRALDLPS